MSNHVASLFGLLSAFGTCMTCLSSLRQLALCCLRSLWTMYLCTCQNAWHKFRITKIISNVFQFDNGDLSLSRLSCSLSTVSLDKHKIVLVRHMLFVPFFFFTCQTAQYVQYRALVINSCYGPLEIISVIIVITDIHQSFLAVILSAIQVMQFKQSVSPSVIQSINQSINQLVNV